MTRSDKSVLFDYYGALLSDRQRECCDLYYNEDFSLSEIAEEKGITKQCAWDSIRHAEARLIEIEEKTGLVAKIHNLTKEIDFLRNCGINGTDLRPD